MAHPVPDLVLGQSAGAAPHRQAEGDIVEHGHMPEQGIVLEHEADPAVARRDIGGVAAIEHHLAGIGEFQAGQDPQQRGLARTRRAQQRDQLAFLDPERHVAERGKAAEGLMDIADIDHFAAASSLA